MRKISLEGMKRKLFISLVSCVLIAAKDGEATPMYKYDYRAIVFGESASEGVQVTDDRLQEKGEKFIKDVKLYHALNDSIVAPENSRMMYEWLVSKGLQNVVIDTTSLTHGHMGSGSYFILNVMTSDLNDW